jgi:hypothetical protein
MKKLLFIVSFLFSIATSAQVATGDWRMFVSPNIGKSVACNATTVLAGYENGILEYDLASGEKSIWNKINGLSDIFVTSIYFHQSSNSFYIAYQNGNLDQWKDGKVTNLPDIKLSSFIGSKTINQIIGDESAIYVATDFSIVKYSISTLDVRDIYYIPGAKCNAISFINDTIYALSPNRLYKAKKTKTNLVDPLAWITENKLPFSGTGEYKKMVVFNNEIIVQQEFVGYATDFITLVRTTPVTLFSNVEVINMQVRDNVVYLSFDGGFLTMKTNFGVTFQMSAYTENSAYPSIKSVDSYDQNVVYAMDAKLGLLVQNVNETSNKFITFSGPSSNGFYSGKSAGGTTIFASGARYGADPAFLTSGCYSLTDETWTSFSSKNQTNLAGSYDFITAAVNPKNTKELALGSYSVLPLALIADGKTVANVYTPANSAIQGQLGYTVVSHISDLNYDKDGNLWIINSSTNNPIIKRDKDGTMHTMITGSTLFGKTILKSVIDENGVIWMAVPGTGVVAFSDNKTPDNPADDKIKVINDGVGTGDLPSRNVNTIAIDLDGELWIGSEAGLSVLYNTTNIFEATNGNYETQQYKFKLGDKVEVFLMNNNVLDIEVDGGNRKWLSVYSSGIFLVNPAGNSVISTFTEKNSPILSDKVRDIVINPVDGETFFMTDKGMVSFRSDASKGDDTYSNVVVFPNPVTPDHEGPITIQGIAEDSDVKFTDAAGNLIYKTTSLGGTATWNGKTLNGERAASGVYFIWTAKNTDKKKYVGKVVFIH